MGSVYAAAEGWMTGAGSWWHGNTTYPALADAHTWRYQIGTTFNLEFFVSGNHLPATFGLTTFPQARAKGQSSAPWPRG